MDAAAWRYVYQTYSPRKARKVPNNSKAKADFVARSLQIATGLWTSEPDVRREWGDSPTPTVEFVTFVGAGMYKALEARARE